jgi:hypothetical protein
MTDNPLPDYIARVIEKIEVGEGLPQPEPNFGKTVSAMWQVLMLSMKLLGEFPQHHQYRTRSLKKDNSAAIVPKSQPNLVLFYLVDEMRETLRHGQLAYVYRLQGFIEDIITALRAGRLPSVVLPTRALMETCASLKDMRRKEAKLLSKVLDMRARDIARTEAVIRSSTAAKEDKDKAEERDKETFFLLFEAVAVARNILLLQKSDILHKEWGVEDFKLPKPTNILTLIDNRLTFSKTAQFSPRYYYELLSEMSHPNMLALKLYGCLPRTGVDGLQIWDVEAKPQSTQIVYMVLGAIIEPIVQCVSQAMQDFVEIDNEINAVAKLATQLRHYLKR